MIGPGAMHPAAMASVYVPVDVATTVAMVDISIRSSVAGVETEINSMGIVPKQHRRKALYEVDNTI